LLLLLLIFSWNARTQSLLVVYIRCWTFFLASTPIVVEGQIAAAAVDDEESQMFDVCS